MSAVPNRSCSSAPALPGASRRSDLFARDAPIVADVPLPSWSEAQADGAALRVIVASLENVHVIRSAVQVNIVVVIWLLQALGALGSLQNMRSR